MARPQAVLFACTLNAARSPMAEAIGRAYFGREIYFASAGVKHGELDPFAVAALDEIGVDMAKHKPRTFEDLEESSFDLIVTLSPEAHHRALQLTATSATEVEYWPTPDPVGVEGRRELQLDAYRNVRDTLQKRIRERFGPAAIKNE